MELKMHSHTRACDQNMEKENLYVHEKHHPDNRLADKDQWWLSVTYPDPVGDSER